LDTPSFLSQLSGTHIVKGAWADGAQASELHIDLQLGDRLPIEDENACGTIKYQVSAQLRTSDGLIDTSASLLVLDYAGHLTAPLPDLPDAYRNPVAPFAGVMNPPEPVPTIGVEFDQNEQIRVNVINEGGDTVGIWSTSFYELPPRKRPAYVVPSLFASICAGIAPPDSGYTSYASADAVLASLAGTWIRCSGEGQLPASYPQLSAAGLQIGADGAWQRLVLENDRLVTRGGFDGEGTSSISDLSAMTNLPGFFQVNLLGHRGGGGGGDLSGDELRLEPDLYVRSNWAVDTGSNPFAARERGGAAACSTAEQGFLEPAPGAELESVLVGDWTLCFGGLPEDQTLLRFDGAGNVAFFDAQGAALGSHSYTVVLPTTTAVVYPRLMSLILDDDTDFSIAISERPLKLWIESDVPSRGLLTAVLSAVP
jgi:hypothetical protein